VEVSTNGGLWIAEVAFILLLLVVEGIGFYHLVVD